ncbi:CU044_5270 family protein [Streptomyces griseiscabiei]|uniref:CU044_5270 family protein n=1 Tax=Streptomyces griseiscabiei TaxID=2993540 RepID=A0ABU4KWA4_9ACTN|nr:CU044_5270 family protein [Streptomyces griseiscabiei]MBZ3903182.1 CU044_5270 family protein [Streptomyces griseiscabiei]MDX2907493.1 CU044_5270 family protein [Streptomyces griseiscabiei]
MRDIDDPRVSRELRDLADYDAGAPPLDEETRRRGRARLLATITAPDTDRPRGPGLRLTAPVHRRPVLRIALSGVVAAAVTAGVLVAVRHDRDDGPGGTAKPPVTDLPPMRNVSARTVLNGAAAYARQHEKQVSPRDDQFMYTKEIIKETERKSGRTKTYVAENWHSVDGSKRSWVMELGKGWWAPPLAANESVWPPQEWSELRKLPTDPERLILAIERKSSGRQGENTSLADISDEEWTRIHFSLAGLLKLVPVMPEGLRPAAYEALGMVPGVKAVPNQKDAKGRVGVAITYQAPNLPGGTFSYGGFFIFDPVTCAFLGFRDVRSSGDGKDMKTYTQLSYLDSWAIVDRAKQYPSAAG